jgi:hypothetical protein
MEFAINFMFKKYISIKNDSITTPQSEVGGRKKKYKLNNF